jgi:hypothetical protein
MLWVSRFSFMLSKAGFVCTIGKFVVRKEDVWCGDWLFASRGGNGELRNYSALLWTHVRTRRSGLLRVGSKDLHDTRVLPSSGSGYSWMHQDCGYKLVSALEIALQPSMRSVMRTVVESRNSSEVCCVDTFHSLGNRHLDLCRCDFFLDFLDIVILLGTDEQNLECFISLEPV